MVNIARRRRPAKCHSSGVATFLIAKHNTPNRTTRLILTQAARRKPILSQMYKVTGFSSWFGIVVTMSKIFNIKSDENQALRDNKFTGSSSIIVSHPKINKICRRILLEEMS